MYGFKFRNCLPVSKSHVALYLPEFIETTRSYDPALYDTQNFDWTKDFRNMMRSESSCYPFNAINKTLDQLAIIELAILLTLDSIKLSFLWWLLRDVSTPLCSGFQELYMVHVG